MARRSEYQANAALAPARIVRTMRPGHYQVLELEPMEPRAIDKAPPAIRWPAPKPRPSRLVRLARFLGLRRGV